MSSSAAKVFEFRHRRIVEFADTDMAGIVHFSRYFRFVEEAEHAFLRSLGLSVHTPSEAGGHIGFPRVSARCEYVRPLRFEDEVETHLWVRRKGSRSLTYQYRLTKDGGEVARGEIVAICCHCSAAGAIEACSMPEAFADRIAEAPYPPLEFAR